MLSFQCLTPLLKIVQNEKSYKIQLLTVEPHQTILQILKQIGLEYRVMYRSMRNALYHRHTNKHVNVIINDSENDLLLHYGGTSFILIGGRAVHGLLHIVFVFEQDEAREYLRKAHGGEHEKDKCTSYCSTKRGKRKQNIKKTTLKNTKQTNDGPVAASDDNIDLLVKKYYRFYTLAQLNSQLKLKKEETIPDLSWLEGAVIFSLCYYNKFADIARNVLKMKNDGNDSFKILMALNKLIKYGFAKRRGGCYSLALSSESVYSICNKIGYDVKKEIEIKSKR